jgi:tagatose-6-phosphate ketose/aldose isomerase
VLDPRTDDQSLVMTASFSNLVVAGLALADPAGMPGAVAAASRNAESLFEQIHETVLRVAALVKNRIVLLSSSPLFPWAREGSLKVTEMAGGRFPVLAETYLGLRHGPMTFLQPDTVVLCLLSSQANRRNYELDLIRELNAKGLGRIVAIGATPEDASLFDDRIEAVSPDFPDELRTPFEILGPQLLGYHLSLSSGLDPDNPSPEGVINRVVQGVKIYSPPAH